MEIKASSSTVLASACAVLSLKEGGVLMLVLALAEGLGGCGILAAGGDRKNTNNGTGSGHEAGSRSHKSSPSLKGVIGDGGQIKSKQRRKGTTYDPKSKQISKIVRTIIVHTSGTFRFVSRNMSK